jgi:uncharacterized membrane protein YkvA (DUF1232 family)
MMALKLELELSEEDLSYYRKLMDYAWRKNSKRDQTELVASARRLLEQTRKSERPEYIKKRLDDLGTLCAMLDDAEWPLEDRERQGIVAAVGYFADPVDLIPDRIPGLGYLDDALMAELVIQEFAHDLQGYREFCEYREQEEAKCGKEAHVSREDWLADKRRQIMLRIRRRREERTRHGSREGPTDPILGFMSGPY